MISVHHPDQIPVFIYEADMAEFWNTHELSAALWEHLRKDSSPLPKAPDPSDLMPATLMKDHDEAVTDGMRDAFSRLGQTPRRRKSRLRHWLR